MAAIDLRIPEEVVRSLKVPPDEVEDTLRTELALALYARGALSLGMARRLAGMTRRDFDALLGKRKIPRHYTAQDLAEDLAYGRGGR